MSDEAETDRLAGQVHHRQGQGKWEYVSRARGIKAAVILAVDDDDHVLLVEQFRVPLGQALHRTARRADRR